MVRGNTKWSKLQIKNTINFKLKLNLCLLSRFLPYKQTLLEIKAFYDWYLVLIHILSAKEGNSVSWYQFI